MGANLVPGGGATFRSWGPLAQAVYINGTFGGVAQTGPTAGLLMAKDANGYWTGFVPTAREGDLYHFYGAGWSSLVARRRRPRLIRRRDRDQPVP